MSAPQTRQIDVSALDPDKWLTVSEAGLAMRVKENTLRSWLRRGAGPPFYRLGGRTIRLKAGDVAAWIEGTKQ
jgi:excisionase family DNA binding protein